MSCIRKARALRRLARTSEQSHSQALIHGAAFFTANQQEVRARHSGDHKRGVYTGVGLQVGSDYKLRWNGECAAIFRAQNDSTISDRVGTGESQKRKETGWNLKE